MDAQRFDILIRSLHDARSRRGALATVLAGTLGLLGRADMEAKKKRKKKKKRNKKEHPSPSPPPPCAGLPDDAPCDGAGKCLQGSCISRPTCDVGDTACDPFSQPDVCCGLCSGDVHAVCQYSSVGQACYATTDCRLGLSCVGYRCAYNLCPAGADSCTDDTTMCRGDGGCFQPLGGGPTRCGKPTAGGSCGCTSHEQCAFHGANAFCVEITGPLCTGCDPFTTFCAVPH